MSPSLQAPDPGEMPDLSELDEISNSEQLAKYLKLPQHTLDTWASKGGGPVFEKVSKYRLYHREDVRAWFHSKRRAVVAAVDRIVEEDQQDAA